MNGFVVWFTGLSGAGKSTLATLLAAELGARGVHVEVLDGDEVRTHLSKGLTFSREDRDVNVRRVGFLAKLLARAGACAITAAISPYRATRDEQRAAIGRFVEVYCKASVEHLAGRDPKGLYKKALSGEIKNFTGVSDPYEEPLRPETVLDTATSSVHECLAQIVARLEQLDYLAPKQEPTMTPAWGGQIVAARPSSSAGPAVESLALSAHDAVVAEAVAFGLLSPLRGPMLEKDATKLAKEGRIESGLAWPVAWTLGLPADGGALSKLKRGDVVDLGGRALEVTEVWADASGSRYVAGEILVDPPRGAVSVRRLLAGDGFSDAAGFIASTPLTKKDELLLSIGLEVRGKLVVFAAATDPAVAAAARAFVARRSLEDRARVIEVPELPDVEPDKEALLHLIALRNLGAGAAILRGREGARAPRELFSELREAEVGIEIVASGPVYQGPTGEPLTPRMTGR